MVTSLDKTKASVTIGEAIGYGNTAEWYREFLYSNMETNQEIKESVKSYAKEFLQAWVGEIRLTHKYRQMIYPD